MMRKILTIAIMTILVITYQSCNKNENQRPVEEASSIFYKSFNPSLSFSFDTIFENDTLTFYFENDSIFPYIKVIYNKAFHYYCSDFGSIHYCLWIDFVNATLTASTNGAAGCPGPIINDSVIDKSYEYFQNIILYEKEDCMGFDYNVTTLDSMKNRIYGLKLIKGENTYFGWINFEFENNSIKINEYAYQTSKVESIKAGQKE